MSKLMMKTVPMVLGVVMGAVLLSANGCDQAQPAVATVSPAEARPGEILIIAGKGLGDQVVKVGEVEAQVKSRGADSLLVVEVPKDMKPGSYDVVVTNKNTKAASKPVKVRVLDLVTVPAGTSLKVRVVQGISSGQNNVGETFLLALDQPLVIEGRTIAGVGSELLGRVVQVDEGGRVKGSARIEFTLVQLKTGSRTYAIATGNVFSQAQSTKKRDALTIGGGAGVGAAIGGLLGGKKGAAIGGGAGGAAGTGVVLATRGKQIGIPSGSRFSFVLNRPLEVQMGGSEVSTTDQ